MKRTLVALAAAVASWPMVAYADNCGSLSDCYGAMAAAAVAIVAIAVLVAVIILAPEIIGLGAVAGEVAGEAAAIEGFTALESGVIREAAAIMSDAAWVEIEAAAEAGIEATVEIAGRTVVFSPGAPPGYMGMALFEENGFVIFNNAFAAEGEVGRTVLHELYRLATTEIAAGASGELAAAETASAAGFAARAYEILIGLLR